MCVYRYIHTNISDNMQCIDASFETILISVMCTVVVHVSKYAP